MSAALRLKSAIKDTITQDEAQKTIRKYIGVELVNRPEQRQKKPKT
jgi:hypothetical protein